MIRVWALFYATSERGMTIIEKTRASVKARHAAFFFGVTQEVENPPAGAMLGNMFKIEGEAVRLVADPDNGTGVIVIGMKKMHPHGIAVADNFSRAIINGDVETIFFEGELDPDSQLSFEPGVAYRILYASVYLGVVDGQGKLFPYESFA